MSNKLFKDDFKIIIHSKKGLKVNKPVPWHVLFNILMSNAIYAAKQLDLKGDDLLATGGTAGAMIKLVEKSGANIVSFAFIIELFDLGGAKRIKDTYGIDSFSLISFPGH